MRVTGSWPDSSIVSVASAVGRGISSGVSPPIGRGELGDGALGASVVGAAVVGVVVGAAVVGVGLTAERRSVQ